ncbi:DUF2017 domain-containing protein [Herbidospora sp. RD11066]
MGRGFKATHEGVAVTLDPAEANVLRSLVASMVLDVVEPGETGDDPLERALRIGPATEPTDPVLARLFPSAYADDDAASTEFRRYTEGDLRDAKRTDAITLIETAAGGRVVLTTEQAQSWLRALNDLRLVLGVRLEITEEMHQEIADMGDDDPRYPAFVTYDWLTYLQDTLVQALW